jgi:tRNA nucleotidyltransferase (CCA-adding enzyme)
MPQRTGEPIMTTLRSTLEVAFMAEQPSSLIRDIEASLFAEFPVLAALKETRQDPLWHPEGDVWTHSLLVIDEAKNLVSTRQFDLSPHEQYCLLMGSLLHDIGKVSTTFLRESDGRYVSPGHEKAGVAPCAEVLLRLDVPDDTQQTVLAIVERHMAPPALAREWSEGKLSTGQFQRAIRRLVRKIEPTRLEVLLASAVADQLGRGFPEQMRASRTAFAEPFRSFLSQA